MVQNRRWTDTDAAKQIYVILNKTSMPTRSIKVLGDWMNKTPLVILAVKRCASKGHCRPNFHDTLRNSINNLVCG